MYAMPLTPVYFGSTFCIRSESEILQYNPKNKPSPMLCCRLLTMSWLIDSSTVLKQRSHSGIAVKESLPYLHTCTSSRPTVCRPLWSTSIVVWVEHHWLIVRKPTLTHTDLSTVQIIGIATTKVEKIKSKDWCNENHTFCQLVELV